MDIEGAVDCDSGITFSVGSGVLPPKLYISKSSTSSAVLGVDGA